MPKVDELSEEFNNFMYRVNTVSDIVKKLASQDKKEQEIGDLEAKNFLGEDKLPKLVEEDNVQLKIVGDRTLLNKKALHRVENAATQSQESFMEEMEKDADRRHKDKLRRRERMETLKTQANKAFRREEYEKALNLYTKAIEQIRDSPFLYNNRALTYINLKFYDKALADADFALRLNENCLKAWLLKAKIYKVQGDDAKFLEAVSEAKERNKDHLEFIEEYVEKLEK